jgi:hypothetical protein
LETSVCLLVIFIIWLTSFPTKKYEFFLRSHQLLGIGVLVGMWWHTRQASATSRWAVYVATSTLIFSLVWDIGSTLWHHRFFRQRWPHAVLTSVEDRITTVRISPTHQVAPGQYVSVWMPGVSTMAFLQSHPFVPVPVTDDRSRQVSVDLLVRPRSGLTFNLLRSAQLPRPTSSAVRAQTFAAVVCGPYGRSISLHGFHHVLMIAWGFCRVAPFLQILAQLSQQPQPGLSVVNLIWQVQHAEDGKRPPPPNPPSAR